MIQCTNKTHRNKFNHENKKYPYTFKALQKFNGLTGKLNKWKTN